MCASKTKVKCTAGGCFHTSRSVSSVTKGRSPGTCLAGLPRRSLTCTVRRPCCFSALLQACYPQLEYFSVSSKGQDKPFEESPKLPKLPRASWMREHVSGLPGQYTRRCTRRLGYELNYRGKPTLRCKCLVVETRPVLYSQLRTYLLQC